MHAFSRRRSILPLLLIVALNSSAQIVDAESPKPDSAKSESGSISPAKRAHHALVFDDSKQRVFMTSGSSPIEGGKSFKFFNDIWYFDQSGWHEERKAGDERSGIALAYHSKLKKIFSLGGFLPTNQTVGEFRQFDDSVWSVITDIPEMNAAEGGLVYDQHRDRLIAFGGFGPEGAKSTTWEWDGTSWKKFAGTGPSARQAFAMIYDARRSKTVLFGGSSGKEKFSDTWEFDGKSWAKVAEGTPGARMACGYAYDSSTGLFVINGGIQGEKIVGDTWGWDGKSWKKLSDSGPPPRTMGYLAYDSKRNRIVLFGGRLGWPNDANDTWEWDGKNWKEAGK